MKHWVLTLLLAVPFLAPAQTIYPQHRTPHHPATRPTAAPTIYVCGGGSAYAYHSSDNCDGLTAARMA